jgi:hypothetical protein
VKISIYKWWWWHQNSWYDHDSKQTFCIVYGTRCSLYQTLHLMSSNKSTLQYAWTLILALATFWIALVLALYMEEFSCFFCYVCMKQMRKDATILAHYIVINPLTTELNPSAQRCLTRFFNGEFASWTVHFVNICMKNQQIHQLFIQFINYVW